MRLVIPLIVELTREQAQTGGAFTEPIPEHSEAYVFCDAFEFSSDIRKKLATEIERKLDSMTKEERIEYVKEHCCD